MFLKVLLAIGCCSALALGSSHWSYSGINGPSHWAGNHPNCGKKRQSPINIVTRKTWYRRRSLENNYDEMPSDLKFSLANNGHSAQVTLSNTGNLHVHVFGQTFKPLQVHFHWGSNNRRGSEHTRDRRRYPGEMHFVHMNAKYGTAEEAKKHRDGLLVLGSFISIDYFENEDLLPIFDSLDQIKKQGQKTEIYELDLNSLMPLDTSEFFFYDGSLTTPGCNQAVKWIVFRNTVPLCQSQINSLRALKYKGSHGASKRIVNNYRPIQRLNGRRVYRTFRLPCY